MRLVPFHRLAGLLPAAALLCGALTLSALPETSRAADLGAAASTQAAQQQQRVPRTRPFRAVVETVERLGIDPHRCAFALVGYTTGNGFARGLGTPMVRPQDVEPAAVPRNAMPITLRSSDCPLVDPASPVMPFSEGRMVIQTIDGDQVYAVYQGQVTRLPGNPLMGSLDGVYTITGGSGRYMGATGSGRLTGQFSFVTLQAGYEAVGEISY